jgi:Cytochrome C oxidase, cbb3-type, subunit III
MKSSQSPDWGWLLLVPFLCFVWHHESVQQKPEEKTKVVSASAEPGPSSVTDRKNPIKPTPENLAEAKKFFAYDCAMCHDASGDGKGELVTSMGLKMHDWHDPSALASMSDSEIFDIIVKGKGKMVGEGDRAPSEMVWKLVNYVRSFANKQTAGIPKAGAS